MIIPSVERDHDSGDTFRVKEEPKMPSPENPLNYPRFFPGEEDAIRAVCHYGSVYGYGNLIARLSDAWSAHLQQANGLDKQTADMAARHICVWCHVDSRTGKKATSAPRSRARRRSRRS